MQKRAFILACAVALLAGYVFAGPRLIRQVKPVYPAEAKQAGVTGTVRLEATIAPDGSVQNVRAASGHALLVPQAIEAVRQWQYEPVLLDGKPVAVMTTITLNFTLPDAIAIEDRPGSGGMRPVQMVRPVYPPEAKANKVTGTVLLLAEVGNDGKVESLRTLKGDPALAAAAEEAVKQWIYEPVRIAGEPVAVLVEIEVNFRLAE
jgi:TonB family protein